MDNHTHEAVAQLKQGKTPPEASLLRLVRDAQNTPAIHEYITSEAEKQTTRQFGTGIFIRGLVEVTNFCRNNCLYCGIRRGNATVQRFRLDNRTVLERCRAGHGAGFRTFVLQGGEDPAFDDHRLGGLVASIRKEFPDSAITLSFGERSRDSYRRLFEAGANRYLLRHETADHLHYAQLHPDGMHLEYRKQCLVDLKEIGYQVGSGFMVGSPYQTVEHLSEDLRFLYDLDPAMVGIGPFIPHHQSPFAKCPAGKVEVTLLMIGLLRLMLPAALIPATTALATIAEDGRERGILAGANVVMPNLSPIEVRGKYDLYEGKLASHAEAAENLDKLEKRLLRIGRKIDFGRGDYTGEKAGKADS